MRGSDVREVFEAILPEEALAEVIKRSGLQQRERKLDALALLRAMVVAAATGHGGRQADILKLYLQTVVRPVARCSFYAWFGPALEQAMGDVRERALEFTRGQKVDLPGVLGREVRDWHIFDSMTVALPDELKEEYPGTGDYAALKVHKRYSVGIGTTVDYHLSPAREHDSLHLKIDETWRGLGLLCDLGYASFARLLDCEAHGVIYILRLKENWKPKVDRVTRGRVGETFLPGMDFDVAIDAEAIEIDGKVFDADVRVGSGAREVSARMIGVPTPKGHCFYLTNAPRSLAPRTISDLYRVRWEIESDNKLDKSSLRIDKIGAETGPAARALVDASMVSSILICLLVHRHQLHETKPRPGMGAVRTTPPIHPQTLGRQMAFTSHRVALAMNLHGHAAQAEWDFLAQLFSRQTDPNWRHRPSILDQMRGWKISPGRPRKLSISAASAP